MNQQARRNLERSASPVELPGLLRRPELCQPALAGLEPQDPKQRPNVDRADDVVVEQTLLGLIDLVAHEGADLMSAHIEKHDRSGLSRRERVDQDPSHVSQTLGVGLTLSLEALAVRLHDRGVGSQVGPTTDYGQAFPNRLPCRSHGIVSGVELPPALVPRVNRRTPAPVLRRLGR